MTNNTNSIIDFHTHTFPDYLAQKAVDKLRNSANTFNYLDGTASELSRSCRDNNVVKSIVLPVATKMGQANEINSKNHIYNKNKNESSLEYFAAIHPDDLQIPQTLSIIKAGGFMGIKLHPVFQNAYIDEDSYLNIIDIASDLGLITVIHAGYDISYPGNEFASVKYIINMIDTLHPKNVVLAHMGGWGEWDIVESDLAGADVYLDTSFCLAPFRKYKEEAESTSILPLSNDQFIRIVNKHGSDKILFGSDSPWSCVGESINAIKNSGLSQSDIEKILYCNASNLLSQ